MKKLTSPLTHSGWRTQLQDLHSDVLHGITKQVQALSLLGSVPESDVLAGNKN